ncbi:hypothetical protein [Nocardioides campestrisoli]|uniref:hypothetical protein n=1 Tax=Nocardioides campestrisoli TaxID=2736757 RepID=UPI001CD30440|nr:hypothetical protein [Nocardioides campestrisoli]
MTTEQAGQYPEVQPGPEPTERSPLAWWHSSHPTFAALTGFFAGMVYVIAVPGAFVAGLRLLTSQETAERYFPFVLVGLVLPALLLVRRKTRRFGLFVYLGMVLTTLVVVGVTSAVLYFLVQADA